MLFRNELCSLDDVSLYSIVVYVFSRLLHGCATESVRDELKAVWSNNCLFVGIFTGLPFGSVETKRKPQLRCTNQMAAVKALECFIYSSVTKWHYTEVQTDLNVINTVS